MSARAQGGAGEKRSAANHAAGEGVGRGSRACGADVGCGNPGGQGRGGGSPEGARVRGGLVRCECARLAREPALWAAAVGLCMLAALLTGPDVLADAPPVPGMPNDLQGVFMAQAADGGLVYLLVAAVVAAYLLGRPFSERTVGLEVASGRSRSVVLGVRCASCLFTAVALTLLALVAGTLRCAGALPAPQPGAWGYLARSACLIAVALAALASPAVLFAAVFRDGVRPLAATVVFLLLALWALAALSSAAPLVPGSAYTNDPGLLLLLHPAFLVRWVLRPDLGAVQALWAVVVSLAWTTAFLGAAWAVLRRCELR